MLLVRFSFCECGSVVCMSPRPAQRSVFASAVGGGQRKHGRGRERECGEMDGAHHGDLLVESWPEEGPASRRPP